MTRIERIYADFLSPEAASCEKYQYYFLLLFAIVCANACKHERSECSICENLCNLWPVHHAAGGIKTSVNPLNPRHPRSH